MALIKIVSFLVFLCGVSATERCMTDSPIYDSNQIPSMKKLDVGKYIGDWYAVKIFSQNPPRETDYKCVRESYSRSKDNEFLLDILYSHIEESTGEVVYEPGYAVLRGVTDFGTVYSSSKMEILMKRLKSATTIIGTDYNTWAVEYSGVLIDGKAQQFSCDNRIIIRSRERYISPEVGATIVNFLQGMFPDFTEWQSFDIDQNNC